MNKYPKVGILSPITFPLPPVGYGPWELVVYNLSEALTQLGVDVTVYATKHSEIKSKLEYLYNEPVTIANPINPDGMTFVHAVESLKKAQSQVDIIHNNLNIYPVLFSELTTVPMVTTLHGAASEKINGVYYEQLKNKNYISLSYSEREYMPDLNYLDNVYNGVDFDKYQCNPNKGEYLVFTGRISQKKGIMSAIKLSKQTGIPLKIAGIISEKELYENEVKPYIDGTQIEYVGNLNYEDLSKLLYGALALVFLIEWNDPCPLSVLDAAASGLPVIGKKIGSIPELVFDPQLGILVDSVEEAASRIGELEKINKPQARELARTKFSREVMAKRYLENYLKLV